MGTRGVRGLGGYIQDQRKSAQISLRQLARLAGVSNPYLSQIERGLRRPSAEILQQIAKGLRISAEAMYIQAGILEERHVSDVVSAVLGDPDLGERQKQVLLEIYDSFRRENAPTDGAREATDGAREATDGAREATDGAREVRAAVSAGRRADRTGQRQTRRAAPRQRRLPSAPGAEGSH